MSGIATKMSEAKFAKSELRAPKAGGWPKIARKAYGKAVRQESKREAREARYLPND